MQNLILSKVEPNSTVPETLCLSKAEVTEIHGDVFGDIYFRFADEPTEQFKYLGQASADKQLQVPIDLMGREIVLSLISRRGEDFSANDPRKGVQTTFTPKPEAFINSDIVKAVSEDIPAGSLIHIYVDTGTIKARLADAGNSFEAHAFVKETYLTGARPRVHFAGINDKASGLTTGLNFLSAASPGTSAAAAPAGSGDIVQEVGIALSATTLLFNPKQHFILS